VNFSRQLLERKGIVGPLGLQLTFYSCVLFFDLQLVNWYSDFYSAIQDKSVSDFYVQLVVFVGITFFQALLLGVLSFNSEFYEARLKRYFAERWVDNHKETFNADYETSKLDQRVLDDATLAAEKIAVVLPALIFNLCKGIVFLGLLSTYPSNLSQSIGVTIPFIDQYGLSVFGFLYLLIQFSIIKLANQWIFKSERIKRKIEAKTRYKLLVQGLSSTNLVLIVSGYIRGIVQIRFAVGRAHGVNVFLLNLVSSLAFLVPFAIIFNSYAADLITFGELMKISATYAGFQGSVLYIFNFYKEALIGLAAVSRLS
jgi:ABC-type uncharacterized transport system fused permease/ATPase subunit